MTWLIHTALANAATVTVLALGVFLVSRCLKRPAVTHALWVLVLLKLVTPPIVGIPVPLGIETSHSTATPVERGVAPQAVAVDQPATPILTQPVVATHTESGVVQPIEPVLESTAPPATFIPSTDTRVNWSDVAAWGLSIWLAGTVVCCVWFASKAMRFRRFLRRHSLQDSEAERRARRLAGNAGLVRCPQVKLVDGVVSPMLWGFGGHAQLLFPRQLWQQLDNERRDALLMHELAHHQRGDQWVRVLELITTVLYWWHPVVWCAKREIEVSEEECVDAWVVREQSATGCIESRCYAEALLTTLDFLSERRAALPPASSGLGNLPLLKRRLTHIMRRSVAASLSKTARRGIVAFSLVSLILNPVLIFESAVSASPTPQALPTLPAASDSAESEALAHEELNSAVENPIAAPTGWWTERPPNQWAVAESPNREYRLLAYAGNRVRLEQSDERGHDLADAGITCVVFTPRGTRFLAGAIDGSVRLWDCESGKPVSQFGRHDTEVTSIAIDPSGRFAASGAKDGTVIIWSLESAAPIGSWIEPERPISCVRFSPDGEFLAVAGGEWRRPNSHRVTLLDTDVWEPRHVLNAASTIAAVEFEENGRLLTADWSGKILSWEPATDRVVRVGNVDKAIVSAATFTPNTRFGVRL